MPDRDLRDVEAFFAEDLLVSLGAMRMALRWAVSDAPGSGLTHLQDELDALADRSRVIFRRLRDPAPVPAPAAPDVATHLPDPPEAGPPLVPEPVEDAPPVVPDPARSQGATGVPPAWLDDIESLDGPDPERLSDPAPDGEGLEVSGAPPASIETSEQTAQPGVDLTDSIDELLATALSSGAEGAGPDAERKRV